MAKKEGIDVRFPDLALCTDNGAMIAGLGCRLLEDEDTHELTLEASSMASD
jgi:tRNA A37 threonylcarbamoyltransferase TsaD